MEGDPGRGLARWDEVWIATREGEAEKGRGLSFLQATPCRSRWGSGSVSQQMGLTRANASDLPR